MGITPEAAPRRGGVAEYRELIERAVEVWNETVRLPSREPLIEIIETRPTNYLLQSSFWSNTSEYGRENLEDDESVIYFKPSGEDETAAGDLHGFSGGVLQ